ncbi:MAG: hypothetical protein JJE09_15795 [Bacteroidia bacterium]|nr:hypothetical protein [Bacteroidia bacterium]
MKKLCFLLPFVISSSILLGQGCSDAGFCTMGAMKPDQPFSKKIALKFRAIDLNFYRGTTTLTPVVYVATADMSFSLNSRNSFQIKLPYQAVTGRLANTSGMGDVSLCYTRNMYTSDKFDLNLSVGGKLPSNKSDLSSDEGFPLPMYYQTSLGTYDLISGLSLINRKWLFATGVQVALNQNNNQFLWGAWKNSDEDPAYIEKYAKAKELKRGVDVMVRIERNFRFSRLNFTAGLLPIYRITNDEITGGTGNRVKPEGAKGLALSGIFSTGYSFNAQSGIKLLLGRKFAQRTENPDGLTRHFVSSFTYYYRFKG